MLPSYAQLHSAILAKTRGRIHEVKINTAPALWARMPYGVDRDIHIILDASKTTICRLHPDNSMEIDINGWHTQLSCKIIEALTRYMPSVYKGRIWHRGYPVDEQIYYDSTRTFIEPPKYVKICNAAFSRMESISFDDLPPKYRLMTELGTWTPSVAITATVKKFVQGNCGKTSLSPRDIITICTHKQAIIRQLFTEAA